jgi:magnesium chelatase subunit H
VIVTLDAHLASAVERVRAQLLNEIPGLDLRFHAATSFSDAKAARLCCDDISQGDIVFANMLFIDEHIRAVLPALQARRDHCDAMVCAMSAAEVMRETRMGAFKMDGSTSGPMALLKKLRGSPKPGASAGGSSQMAALKLLPKLLRFVPGKTQDLRSYLLVLSYWLSGSTENLADLIRLLISRYADGPRKHLREQTTAQPPREYPETGLYHPRLASGCATRCAAFAAGGCAALGRTCAAGRMTTDVDALPRPEKTVGTIGLMLLRSYVLSNDAGHYDRVIEFFEKRGLRVIPAYAAGLDGRPAIDAFFMKNGKPTIDVLVSLTGFSLVGGPAFNDSKAAEEVLTKLDVPYIAAQPLEFQSIEAWKENGAGLTPIESTIMLAIPELDGATGPIVFGGRPAVPQDGAAPDMVGIDERIEMLAARVEKLVRLRKAPVAERKVGIVLFNFPPNGGATGTAAYLGVFESLFATLTRMKTEGYTVDVPANVEALRERLIGGNSARYGTDANVLERIPVDRYVRAEKYLPEIEKAWGSAPGKFQSDGSTVFVLGAHFGNVAVGIQPAFGYEGDPMRLLYESGFAPTHAFAAFYRWLREFWGAHVVLHFGTHGALEFMPGKQGGLSGACWPDRLIGDLPNLYLYAANNPAEGAIARRRSAATLISYMTPPVSQAGLYRGLLSLRESIDRLRGLAPGDAEVSRLVPVVQAQAVELDLATAEPVWTGEARAEVDALLRTLIEVEQTLIPCGLHVMGQPMPEAARRDYLKAIIEGSAIAAAPMSSIDALLAGKSAKDALRLSKLESNDETVKLFGELERTNRLLTEDHELPSLMHALGGGFVKPAPGGDVLRNPAVLPTGRNMHGFDPFAIPSAFAVMDGAQQAARLLAKHIAEGNPLPESVAIVLWGADTLKTGGGPIGQALALLGARPRFDSYGRLCGAQLVPLVELGRPRIDVLITLSGIFRDLLPMQTRLLAEAAFLAADADEPLDQNFVRRHALEYQKKHHCDLETAALRVFSNGDGAYGSNVNQLIDAGTWQEEDELAETYTRRKSFAFGRKGAPVQQTNLLKSVLGEVSLAYQNLESAELGITSLDQYFDTLGGISRAAKRESGKQLSVYIGDQTRSDGVVRTLTEQVNLESRTRSLNPKWAEEMLKHGAEGVRQIESQVTNTFGWSATTGHVEPWVYRELTETYVLDPVMRERLAKLNPKASVKLANRLLEASERNYWKPDDATLEALRNAGDELEDRLEGINP